MNYSKDKSKNGLDYFLWLLVFLALLAKCIIFIGFTDSKTHLNFNFREAMDAVKPRLQFYCAFIAIVLCFAFLLKNRIRLWFLFFSDFFLSVLLMIDLWYFRGFMTMPSLHLLKQTSNLDNLSSSILSLIHPGDFIFILDAVILLIIILSFKGLSRKTDIGLLSFAVLFLISLSVLLYIPVRSNLFGIRDSKAIFSMLDPNITAYNLSPIGYHVLNTYSFYADGQTFKLTTAGEKEIKKWYGDKKETLPDNKYKARFKGKNLIIIRVESLEQFVIKQKVNGQEVTPTLNTLLKNSLYFSDYHEQVNQGTTSDAEFMTNTSLYPLAEGSAFFRYPFNAYPESLPKLMQHMGYSTLAIHPDKGSYWNWLPALKSIGFENCVDSAGFVHDESIGMGLSDGSFLKQVEEKLRIQKPPFFSYIITLSSHAPYDIPEKYRELKLDPVLDKSTLGGYFQSVHYVDTQIGIFLESLKKDGLLDNSLIVIYGDHEGIHKYYQGDLLQLKSPESWWMENNKRVPLILYQNQQPGEEIKTTGGQVDLLPTLAYLMGIDEKSYENTAMGRNLLNTARSFAVLRDRTYIGAQNNKKQVDHDIQGMNIADIIIRSNYFKK